MLKAGYPARLAARLLLTLLPAPVYAADLTVTFSDIRSQSGTLRIAVLDSEAAYSGEKAPVLSLLLPPRGERVSFSTDALAEGSYAIRVMHDANGNGELDNNLVGMPTEPWGFSNNAVGGFGPPKWEDIRFELGARTQLDVRLNH